ncbi:MAG: peptide chain release factor 1, partial [Erysipelotrichaceae bacterium]|nr:peptide chain release factor 1 [Erysipelotrichaceae bacterium]
MEAVIAKLKEIEGRYNEIADLMVSDEMMSKPRELGKLAKEQAG